jgi:hypothetical protein
MTTLANPAQQSDPGAQRPTRIEDRAMTAAVNLCCPQKTHPPAGQQPAGSTDAGHTTPSGEPPPVQANAARSNREIRRVLSASTYLFFNMSV